MILENGDKVLIAHRRLFPDDAQRFFVGTVCGYESGIARVSGYSWVREPVRGSLERKSDERTKIVSIASGSLIVYRLPCSTNVEHFEIHHGPDQRVVLRDGRGFEMDLGDPHSVRLGTAA